MADLVITASSVAPGAGAVYATYMAGGTLTAGQVVYYDSSTGTVKAADADASAATALILGVALNGASSGQPVSVQTGGYLTINAVATKGVAYYLSPNAGGIAPFADVLSGDYYSFLGLGVGTTSIYLAPFNSGVTA